MVRYVTTVWGLMAIVLIVGFGSVLVYWLSTKFLELQEKRRFLKRTQELDELDQIYKGRKKS